MDWNFRIASHLVGMARQGLSRQMGSGGSSNQGSFSSSRSPIVDLPVEILLKIFDYFDPSFLVHTVSLVCKRFATILKDDNYYWRSSYYKLMTGYHTFESFPILERYGVLNDGWRCEPDVHWKDLTLRLKKLHDRWTKPVNTIKLHSSTEAVDALHILQNTSLCLTGSREKCIDLWSIDLRPYIKSSVVEAHRGWVSDIQSFEADYFLSGSWDSTVSYWNIGPTMCEALWTFDCGRAVFSLAARPGLVVAGLYGPQIVLIDPRIRQTLDSIEFYVHDRPIVAVKLMDNYVLSVARDFKLSSFDIRKQAIVQKIDFRTQRLGMPLCMAIRNNIIYIGDSRGCIYLFDVAHQSFDKFQQIPINPLETGASPQDCKVKSICPELGAIMVGCSNRSVQIVVPCKPLYKMRVLDFEHEVTSMSYRKSILAVGKANGAVDVYKPGLQGTLTIVPLTEIFD